MSERGVQNHHEISKAVLADGDNVVATKVSYHQPGDPLKLAAAIVRLTASPKPPVHLPLGSDTLKHYREKTEAFNTEIAEWHEVITGTDHDDVATQGIF